MAYIINIQILAIFLVLFNRYDCQFQGPPPYPIKNPSTSLGSYFQNSLLQDIPQFGNDFSFKRLLSTALTNMPTSMYSKTPRQVINALGNSLQKVFDLFEISPDTCTYIIDSLNGAHRRVGEFSTNATNEYAKATSKQFLVLLEKVISQLPSCSSPQNIILLLLTKQLKRLPTGNLQIASDTVSGDDISNNLLQFLEEQGDNSQLSPLSKSLDVPLSEIMLKILLQTIANDLTQENENQSFYNLIGRLGQGVKTGVDRFSPYLTTALQNQ